MVKLPVTELRVDAGERREPEDAQRRELAAEQARAELEADNARLRSELEALRTTHGQLVAAVAATRMVVWYIDLLADKYEISENYELVFGRKPSTHARGLDYVHPDDRERVRAHTDRVTREGGAFQIEFRVLHAKTQQVIWLLERGEVLLDLAGRPKLVVGIDLDVTERKQAELALERTKERLERTLDSITDGYFAIDREGRFLDANRIAERHFGKSGDELRQATFWELIGEPATEEINQRSRAVIEAGRHDHFEYASRLREGVWVEAHYYARAGGVVEVYYRDITERKRAEQALLEANRRKDQFLATLSHELRNPLAPIRSSLCILDRAQPGSEQAQRARAIIDRQTTQLSRLVDDLLDVTRITRNVIQLQRQRLEVNQLVRATVEDHRPLFEQHGVSLELATAPAPVSVDADPSRLAQVVGNLLHNAVKFTGPKGTVRVTVASDAARRQAVITVEDTGVGMSSEMLARLFQPFSQEDQPLDRSKGGLGLGLALVKGLVKLHGGAISGHSAGLGAGSKFVVELPLEVPVPAPPADPRSEGDRKGRRILVIEDNHDAADSLREVLELDDHVVEVAYDGIEGLRKARTFHPDVVLCDIGLPGMDGYQVARSFRADEALQGVFLIALSGYAMPEDLERARAAGFHRHIAKPPSLERIEAMIAQAPVS